MFKTIVVVSAGVLFFLAHFGMMAIGFYSLIETMFK